MLPQRVGVEVAMVAVTLLSNGLLLAAGNVQGVRPCFLAKQMSHMQGVRHCFLAKQMSHMQGVRPCFLAKQMSHVQGVRPCLLAKQMAPNVSFNV